MARPTLGETETERVNLLMTAAEVNAINDWRYRNKVKSLSEAIRVLCNSAITREITGAGADSSEAGALPSQHLNGDQRKRLENAVSGMIYPPSLDALIARGVELALRELEAVAPAQDDGPAEPVFPSGIIPSAEMKVLLTHPTADVPDVGRIFLGLGRNASYDAANRGDIPIIKVGGRKKVVMRELCDKLGISTRYTSGGAE